MHEMEKKRIFKKKNNDRMKKMLYFLNPTRSVRYTNINVGVK